MIEPLESRIAPASITPIILGAGTSLSKPLTYADTAPNPVTGQIALQFINAGDPSLSGVNLSIAKTVGQNPNVYFIKVTAGEEVEIPTAVGYQPMVNVTHGTVIAFFNSTGGSTYNNGTVISPVVQYNQLTGVAWATNFGRDRGRGPRRYRHQL